MRIARQSSGLGWWLGLALVAVLSMMACARQERPSAMTSTDAVTAAATTPRVEANVTAPLSGRTYTRPDDAELRKRLTPLEYEVTQNAATEPSFRNRYWDNHAPGLYVDVATGEPLFSSADKFESGTGWPSFSKPIEANHIVTTEDVTLGMTRTEARSRVGGSHLGHVFDDGPPPTGMRYCMNSASLRFIPLADLEKAGYGEYRKLISAEGAAVSSAEPSSTASQAQAKAPAPNSCTVPGPGQAPGCQATLDTAILAGGCFWGMEEILRKIPGVLETEVGYEGGTTANPTYEDVHTGTTGHAEAVRVTFDPAKLSYEDLLEKWFFRMHDPTTKNRQGNDVGTQYRSAIFVTSKEQREIALRVKARVGASGKWHAPIQTEIADAGPFTLAEDYHQKYLEKNPGGYTCHFMRE